MHGHWTCELRLASAEDNTLTRIRKISHEVRVVRDFTFELSSHLDIWLALMDAAKQCGKSLHLNLTGGSSPWLQWRHWLDGNDFWITGPLWRESVGYRWITSQRASNGEFDVIFDFLEQAAEQTIELPVILCVKMPMLRHRMRWCWAACQIRCCYMYHCALSLTCRVFTRTSVGPFVCLLFIHSLWNGTTMRCIAIL